MEVAAAAAVKEIDARRNRDAARLRLRKTPSRAAGLIEIEQDVMPFTAGTLEADPLGRAAVCDENHCTPWQSFGDFVREFDGADDTPAAEGEPFPPGEFHI
jgi:hypothetical protein